MKSLLLLSRMAILLALLPRFVFCQPLEQDFDTLLNRLFQPGSPSGGPGGTVLVAKDGKVLYRKAFGLADIESGLPMKPEHVLRLGSITKQFTACAILKLVEEGKLSLQDPITRFVKDYPMHGHTITVEQVLTHTAGIKNLTSLAKWTPELRRKDFSARELVDFFKNEPMDFAPGTEFRYSNSGYILLGYVIEVVTGKSYEQYLTETFLGPLGLENTAYDSPTRLVKNRVGGYQKGRESMENADYLSMTQPFSAGALLSTVDDLHRWYTALMAYKVVRKESLDQAHTPYRLSNGRLTEYGYGWELGNIQGSRAIRHSGKINGFLTFVLYLPEEKVFAAILSNYEGTSDLENTTSRLAALTIGKPYPTKSITLPTAQLQSYEGVYQTPTGGSRLITYEGDRLLVFSPGGAKSQLLPFEPGKFYQLHDLTTLEFAKNTDPPGVSFVARGTGVPITWVRTDQKISKPVAIPMSAESLEKYVGRYQFTPNFILSIIKEGPRLYGLATGPGQIRQEILPYDTHQFFAKDLDARLVFEVNGTGNVLGLTLIQNGEKKAARLTEPAPLK